MRKIVHVDCDCFFAAIEMRDDPALRTVPLAVGGASDRRGVISTCNYEARRYGVRSAMSSAMALKLCPGLVLVPGNMEKYREASQQIRRIFYEYTDLVEPLSLDEAYLDVSASTCCQGSATLMATEMRHKIESQVGITVSAGIAPNKFLAKIASDWNKPNGQLVITPDDVDDFVKKLPVNKIHGVGKVMAQKLESMGIVTCADVRRYELLELVERFGKFGQRLHSLAQGVDDREVKTNYRRKSLSVEHTYPEDLPTAEACCEALPELFLKLKGRLKKVDDDFQITKELVKLKFNDFTTTTIERGCDNVGLGNYKELCETAFYRGNKPVRLIGVGVRFVDLKAEGIRDQLELFARSDLPS